MIQPESASSNDDALREWLVPSRCALLIVDMQNDWLHDDGGMARSGADISQMQAIIPTVQRVIASASNAGVVVIYMRAWQTQWTLSRAQRERVRWSPVRAGGTRGFADTFGGGWCGVTPGPNDPVISKSRYDAFLGTDLEHILFGRGIDSVVCAGVATDVCVESTARSAFQRGFNVVVVKDATATTDAASRDASLSAIRKYFGLVEPSDAVVRAWQRNAGDHAAPTPTAVRV